MNESKEKSQKPKREIWRVRESHRPEADLIILGLDIWCCWVTPTAQKFDPHSLSQSLILLKPHSSIDMLSFPYYILKQNTEPRTKISFFFQDFPIKSRICCWKREKKRKAKAKQYTEGWETRKETTNKAMKTLQACKEEVGDELYLYKNNI